MDMAMDNIKTDQVLAFDTLFTNNHIQKMKIFLPLLDDSMQKNFAVYIKYLELQYTISFFERKESDLHICSRKQQKASMDDIFDELICYCSESEKKSINQMKQMMNTFKTIQEMQPFLEMMNAMSSEQTQGDGNGSGFNTDMLKQMLTPEQQAMFEMFQNTL